MSVCSHRRLTHVSCEADQLPLQPSDRYVSLLESNLSDTRCQSLVTHGRSTVVN